MASPTPHRPHPRSSEPVVDRLSAVPPGELNARADLASDFFKALGDPTRLRILYLIASQPNAGISSNSLANTLGLSAPTITHHMKKLLSVDLVTRRKDGRWGYYSINPENSETVTEVLTSVLSMPRSHLH
ncbi:ArsR/SmtB family transcription factor [Corynebacterium pacaense]|uniref:ArsR/SmtB family transcription factor n=1 Tax=Corynebacterium pacaense TaxID=1816684 RepID=UPI0009BADCD1|nr:metalloregulator ArsR/SmtB family transcription factor [Corynebacterium pacaense]